MRTLFCLICLFLSAHVLAWAESINPHNETLSAERQEFDSNFFADEVYFVVAAENNYNPASMMGHSFLRFKGQGHDNAFSYFTDISDFLNYTKNLLGFGEGFYIVRPYSELIGNYIVSEKRSVWEFKLDLSEDERSLLKEKIWGLYKKSEPYRFISHNCNSVLIGLLSEVSPNYKPDVFKPYITPVEYAQFLVSNGKAKEITYRPPSAVNAQPESVNEANTGIKNILDAKPPARIAILGGTELFSEHDTSKVRSTVYIELSPVYQDIRSTGDAYPAELETKLSYLKLRKRQGGGISISDYALIRLKAIRDISTYFNLGYEEDYLSAAAGIGAGFVRMLPAGEGGFSAYFLPIAGIRHGTGYIEGEFGFISRIGSLFKIGISASAGTDYHSAKAFLSISLGRNVDILAEYEGRYAGNSDKIGIKGISSDNFNSIKAGVSFFF